MAGFCGYLGQTSADTRAMASDLVWTGEEATETFAENAIEITDVSRPDEEERPVETGDGDVVWVWGTVFGADGDAGYESRPVDTTTTGYCADRFERDGRDFVEDLNGHYFGIVYEPSNATVTFFTDRLGLVDVYHAKLPDGSLVLSTHLQSFDRVSEINPDFDVAYLSEFFTFTRSMGVKTPLRGVECFPPASVISVDLDELEWSSEQYWTPRYRPIKAEFPHFVEMFVDRFRAALTERTAAAGEYGLLLSGGSDSRLILAALEDTERVTAYHMADWMSREARTAERVAITADVGFTLLRRDVEDLPTELRQNAKLCSFNGRFDQAHAEWFLPDLREEVDYLMDGLYADILFKGWGLHRRRVSLGPLGDVRLPVAHPVESVEDYLDRWNSEIPRYVRTSRSMRDILEENVYVSNGRVHHHGVELRSPIELMVWSHVFPQTNMGGGFQIQSIRQHLPYHNPFLDNRLVDLSLSMPLEYFVRKDIVAAAVERLAPDLAAIPHPDAETPLSVSFPIGWMTGYANAFWRKFVRTDAPSRPDLDHGPWQPHPEIIRVHDFVGETIAEHEETIRALSFLDWDRVNECYRDHREGANHVQALYTLVTFLEMPLTQRLAGRRECK